MQINRKARKCDIRAADEDGGIKSSVTLFCLDRGSTFLVSTWECFENWHESTDQRILKLVEGMGDAY